MKEIITCWASAEVRFPSKTAPVDRLLGSELPAAFRPPAPAVACRAAPLVVACCCLAPPISIVGPPPAAMFRSSCCMMRTASGTCCRTGADGGWKKLTDWGGKFGGSGDSRLLTYIQANFFVISFPSYSFTRFQRVFMNFTYLLTDFNDFLLILGIFCAFSFLFFRLEV